MVDWLWLLIPLGFVGFWLGLCALLAWLGGWSALARRYRATGVPQGERFRMQSAGFGGIDYNGCLTFRVSPEGLYFAIWPILRFCHPPLLLPWSSLHVDRVRERWWLRVVAELSVSSPPQARIRVPLRVVEAAQKLMPPGEFSGEGLEN